MGNENVVSISSLTMNDQRQPVIRAKLLKKTIGHYAGSGSAFDSLYLKDESGEIMAVNYSAENRVALSGLKVDAFYIFSGFSVWEEDELFHYIHKYRIRLDTGMEVKKYTDELNVPDIKYSFQTVKYIWNMKLTPEDIFTDFAGFCINAGETTEPRGEGGKVLRDNLIIEDLKGQSIKVVCWDAEAEDLPDDILGAFFTFKYAKVIVFDEEKKLSVLPSTIMKIYKKYN